MGAMGLSLLMQDCVLCRAASGDALICDACDEELPAVTHACPQCGGPSASGATCGACLAVQPSFDATISAWRYEFPVDRLVHALKYGGRVALAHAFAAALAKRVVGRRVDAIVPVPISATRLMERGFNQAMEIARHLARSTGCAINRDVLRRVRDTVPQADLPHDAREANVRGAFASTGAVAGMTIGVVDDVMTTGASLQEIARTLKRAGALRVENWVVARTWPK
jgi:ComF family protein